MSWYKLIKISSNILINIEDYKNSLQSLIDELIDFNQKEKTRISNFKINIDEIESSLRQSGFNQTDLLINEIKSRDIKRINEAIWNLYQFLKTIKTQDYMKWQNIFNVWKTLRDYEKQIDTTVLDSNFNEVEVYNDLVNKTSSNMQIVKNFIAEAILRINNWNNSQVTIEAREVNKDDKYLEPVSDATIYIGTGDYSPLFTFFIDKDKIHIDDIFEAGDMDYFSDHRIQQDYFNLIFELQKPGSTSKDGKTLTLYTARPKKDRKIYENATSIPSNIFLTNNVDSAFGIGQDMGDRDVWKIKINEKHLIQTLDGTEKQYQVIGNGNVPVKSIEFLG